MEDLTQTQTAAKLTWGKAILIAGMLLFAFYASTHMVAAGDTWVAMACGRHFDNHGVDTVEPFSFNSHHAGPSKETLEKFPEWSRGLIKKWHPTGWINQNWLTHLIFYKLASWFGDGDTFNYNTLVYWKFVLFTLTVFCVYAVGKVVGAGDTLSAAGACLAMVVGRTFYDIRPACYSNLLVPLLILIFALTVYKNYKLIWLLIPLVLFWANVHGGYIYAFIMLVPFVGIHLLLQLPKRWSICLGLSAVWLVIYLISYKFLNNDVYLTIMNKALGKAAKPLVMSKDIMLLFWLILVGGSVTMACLKERSSASFYVYHFIAGATYFLCLSVRFIVDTLPVAFVERNEQYVANYKSIIQSSLLSFVFISLVGTALIFALALKKDRFIQLRLKGIYHTICAGIAAFFVMIIFNPFHLTNLTHTFEISVSKHAASWRRVNEWHPAFDFMNKLSNTPNPVGKEGWFGFMCVLTAVVLVIWLVAYFLLKPRTTQSTGRRNPAQMPESNQIPWPKVDLAVIVLSFLTIYMAIRSRRFIALAGPTAMPVIMLLIYQCWQMISTKIQYSRGKTEPVTIPASVQKAIFGGLGIAVIGLGLFWGAKYKRIYLDPWPTDDRYNNVFMRMTASHLKPFEVCEFINDNQISGKVFNYWTEGGAVAFGQTPDPETGQIPLKLFMDGRAQAAYDHDTFVLWQTIHNGGTSGRKAAQFRNTMNSLAKRGKTQTTEYKKAAQDYKKILPEVGTWINEQLKQRDVWIILMPKTQQDSIFMRSLATTKKWKTAYLDSKQQIQVNIETPQGKDLITRILNDKAVFPDSFSKNMTTTAAIFENQHKQRYKDTYDLTKTAFDEHPYPVAALAMTRLTALSVYKDKVAADLQAYLDDFLRNQDTYKQQDGYFLRLGSAEVAARSRAKTNPKEAKKYREIADKFKSELKTTNTKYIW
ncbi:MAG: hypothetical protein ACYTET_01915 [Planctomycetota bacterium]|jgi:hypothetical protein